MEPKRSKYVCRRILLTGFILYVALVTEQTCGLDVQADPEVIVQNGTTGVLRCSFKSSEVVTKRTTVTWKFQSNQPNSRFYDAPHVIFYFSDGQGYPGLEEFKERVQFIGDINKRDVSIQLSPTQFSDNGTFICDVKNPPDVSGTQAETLLRVVLKGPVGANTTSRVFGPDQSDSQRHQLDGHQPASRDMMLLNEADSSTPSPSPHPKPPQFNPEG